MAKAKKRRVDSDRYHEFVRALAEYLVGSQVEMSVKLQLGRPEAKIWAKLRSSTPLFGYPTVDEAEKTLAAWLGASSGKAARK